MGKTDTLIEQLRNRGYGVEHVKGVGKGAGGKLIVTHRDWTRPMEINIRGLDHERLVFDLGRYRKQLKARA
jgi:hypothetical protein